MPQTTKIPTASKATSFTTASTAMAMTMPWCCSSASRLRVPNRMVNSASPPATQIAVASRLGRAQPSGVALAKTPKDSVTDCNCSAIYGVAATTAMTVTITPSRFDLPKRLEIRSAIDVTRCCRPIRTNLRSTHHQPTNTSVGPR